MDEKVKEIEKRLSHCAIKTLERDDIKYLLSLLSEQEKKIERLEKGIDEIREEDDYIVS